MLPSTSVTLVGSAAAVALAAVLGGAVGAGVAAGFAAGAALALASGRAQRRIARRRPALLLPVLGGGFAVKIVALFALTACVSFVPPLAAELDLRAFALAFAAAILGLLPCTTWELVRLTQGGAASNARPLACERGTAS